MKGSIRLVAGAIAMVYGSTHSGELLPIVMFLTGGLFLSGLTVFAKRYC